MRLWTIDPSQLDSKGLVALWRESLLAQAVLAGETKGYKNHPQLDRFRGKPIAMRQYLLSICHEATRRGYAFDIAKIHDAPGSSEPIKVTSGQIDYEVKLLQSKLDKRAPGMIVSRKINSVFVEVGGDIEQWEKIKGDV